MNEDGSDSDEETKKESADLDAAIDSNYGKLSQDYKLFRVVSCMNMAQVMRYSPQQPSVD